MIASLQRAFGIRMLVDGKRTTKPAAEVVTIVREEIKKVEVATV